MGHLILRGLIALVFLMMFSPVVQALSIIPQLSLEKDGSSELKLLHDFEGKNAFSKLSGKKIEPNAQGTNKIPVSDLDLKLKAFRAMATAA